MARQNDRITVSLFQVFELAKVPLSTSCQDLYYDKQVNYPAPYMITSDKGDYQVVCNFNNEFKFHDWQGNKMAQQSLLFGNSNAIRFVGQPKVITVILISNQTESFWHNFI